jgi:hypothetical protein
MRRATLVILVLAAVLAAPASAEGPGSFARLYGPYGGPIRLDANFHASDTCQAALEAHQAAPAGQRVPPFVVPVTIVIGPNPLGCTDTRIVRRIVTVGGAGVDQMIRIFFVNPSGRILKTENVAVQSQ